MPDSILDSSTDDHKHILQFEYSTGSDPEEGFDITGGCECGNCKALHRADLYAIVLETLEQLPLNGVADVANNLKREVIMAQAMMAAKKNPDSPLGIIASIMETIGAPMPGMMTPETPDQG